MSKDMKKKRILVSKVLLGLLFAVLAVWIAAAIFTGDDEVVMLPNWIGIPSVIIFVLNILMFILLFVLEVRHQWELRKGSAITEVLIQFILTSVIVIVLKVIIFRYDMNLAGDMMQAAVITISGRALDYWKS